MSPELITLIAMFIAIVGIFINQSNKFDKLNDKIDSNHKELSKEITNFKIETTNNFSIMNDRLSKIESHLDISDERYTITNQRVDKLETDIKEIKVEHTTAINKFIDKLSVPAAASLL